MDAICTGGKISGLRKERGLTQKDLAELLHVTNKAVSKWERGKNFPDLALIQPLAEALDTTVSELLCVEQPITDETIAVLSAISQQEKRAIKWSLYEFLFMVALVSFYSAFKAYHLQVWWLLTGNVYVFFTSLFLAGMFTKKFSSKAEFQWPKNQDAELYSKMRISLSLWNDKLRGR